MTNEMILSRALKEIHISIANQIVKLRHKLGYPQRKFAEQAHLNPYLISRIENVQCKDISIGTLVKIARTLHTRLEIKFI